MQLFILSATKISEANRQFKFYFPNLQLAFYQRASGDPMQEIKEDLVLLQLPWFKEGIFPFHSKMLIADFEEAIYQQHGLNVNVQVKIDGMWMDASIFGNLTLEVQNEVGKSQGVKFNMNPATLFL